MAVAVRIGGGVSINNYTIHHQTGAEARSCHANARTQAPRNIDWHRFPNTGDSISKCSADFTPSAAPAVVFLMVQRFLSYDPQPLTLWNSPTALSQASLAGKWSEGLIYYLKSYPSRRRRLSVQTMEEFLLSSLQVIKFYQGATWSRSIDNDVRQQKCNRNIQNSRSAQTWRTGSNFATLLWNIIAPCQIVLARRNVLMCFQK